MAVSVRAATPADVLAIVKMGAAMHAESPRYSHLSYNADKCAALAERVIATGGALVAERDGIIIGMMAGFVAEYWFGDDLVASDFVLYIVPEERRKGRAALMLVRAFEAWARSKGVRDIAPGATTGVDVEATASFFEKLGYERTGISLFKRVSDV